ncbi:hypothetical protein [Subtercola sp. YIM 133946]|uniref:hypothetical protein n=1 Tax=Subtercola sp. YIM 133946 TaxID=3118909 RepID=UPI002F92589C
MTRVRSSTTTTDEVTRRRTCRVIGAAVALALAGTLALSACTGQAAPTPVPTTASATPTHTATVAPTVPATATPTVTSSPTNPQTTSPTDPADPAAAARANVVSACETWQTSLSQDASTFPGTQAGALALAQSAAAGDAQWQPVVDTMQTLVSLIGDNSSAGVAKGQAAFTDLGNECQAVGVVVNGG